MRKDSQNILTNKEKNRHFYSAYFFSKGAANELKNKFKNDGFDKIKKLIEDAEEHKKKQLEKREKEKAQKKQKSKFQKRLEIFKFIAIGATVGFLGYQAIDKLNDLYKSFVKPKMKLLKEKTEEIKVPDFEVTDKINSKLPNFEEKYVRPVKDYTMGTLGIKPELLINSAYNKQIGGPIGAVLPKFALLTLIYVFRKLGHGWLLDVLNIKAPSPYDYDILIGMWDILKGNKRSYYASGKQDVLSAELGNVTTVQFSLGKYGTQITEFMAEQKTDTNAIISIVTCNFSDYELGTDTSGAVYDVLKHYSDIQSVMRDGWKFKELTKFVKTGGKSVDVDLGEEYGTIRLSSDSKDFTRVYFSDEIDDWEETYRAVSSPSDYKWLNTLSRDVNDMYFRWGNNEIFSDTKLGEITRSVLDGKMPGDDEKHWWNAERLAYLLQIYVAVSSWLAHQQLSSEKTALYFYNKELDAKNYEQMLNDINQKILKEAKQAEAWEIQFAQGRITFNELYKRYIQDLKDVIKAGFLSKLKQNTKRTNLLLSTQIYNKEQILDSIEDLKQKIKGSFLSSKRGAQVSVITFNQITKGLRPNYKELVGHNLNGLVIEGWNKNGKAKLLDYVFVKDSAYKVYNLSPEAHIFGVKSPPTFCQYIFKKESRMNGRHGLQHGLPPLNPDNPEKDGWWEVVSGKDVKSGVEDYWHGKNNGDGMWGYGIWSYYYDGSDWKKPTWLDSDAKVYTVEKRKWVFSNTKAFGTEYRYENYIVCEPYQGSVYTNAYEYLDEDGNVGIVHIKFYKTAATYPETIFKAVFVKEEESQFSDTAKFKKQIVSEDETRSVEEKLKIIVETVDYVEVRKKQLIRERQEIISKILENSVAMDENEQKRIIYITNHYLNN